MKRFVIILPAFCLFSTFSSSYGMSDESKEVKTSLSSSSSSSPLSATAQVAESKEAKAKQSEQTQTQLQKLYIQKLNDLEAFCKRTNKKTKNRLENILRKIEYEERLDELEQLEERLATSYPGSTSKPFPSITEMKKEAEQHVASENSILKIITSSIKNAAIAVIAGFATGKDPLTFLDQLHHEE